jgi:serine phosphatase RsbU (regulator of sigma subunit)
MALGMDRDLEPEIVELRVEPGDWVLLHTDGFRRQHRETLFSFQARDLPQDQAISMAIDRLRTDDFRDNTSFLLLVAS